MPDLTPYREILRGIGFKESESQRNFWTIKSTDLLTGKPATAGIHLGFWDGDLVGEPHLETQDGEIMDKTAYQRSANLMEFHREREAFLEKGDMQVVVEEVTNINDVFGEPKRKIPFNPQPTESSVTPPKVEVRPIEEPPKLSEILKKRLDDIKEQPTEAITPRVAVKPPQPKPQVAFQVSNKERVVALKQEKLISIQHEIGDLGLQIEAIKEEILERRREDQQRLYEFESKLQALAMKEKLVEETYDQIIKEIP